MRCPADLHLFVCVCASRCLFGASAGKTGWQANPIPNEKSFGVTIWLWRIFIMHRHFDIYILCIRMCLEFRPLFLWCARYGNRCCCCLRCSMLKWWRRKNCAPHSEHNERRNGTYKIFSHRIIMYYFILRFGLTLWLLVRCECLCLCIDGDVVNVVASFSMCCYASSIRTRPFPPERVRSNALSCSIKLFRVKWSREKQRIVVGHMPFQCAEEMKMMGDAKENK